MAGVLEIRRREIRSAPGGRARRPVRGLGPKEGSKKSGLGGGAVGPACAPRVLSTEGVQRAVRANVTCVTPLGEDVASTW